jgi:flagellar FliL protein
MAAKPDPKEKEAAPGADKAVAAADASPKKGGGLKAWLPVLAALVVAPGATFAVAQFVLLPKLKAELVASLPEIGADGHAVAPKKKAEGGEKKKEGGHGGKEGGKEGAGDPDTYNFENVVVNLSGTMGTRYLKTSFVVKGAEKEAIREAFEENKARLTDVTLGVLSSLTLSDLEEPGAKNVLREKLVTAYNQALGSHVAEQVYFSDFVVQ